MSCVIKKVLITNIVSLNPGDAAILKGTYHILKKKYGDDVEIIVFDRQPKAAAKYYPWANFKSSLFPSKKYLGVASFIDQKGYGHWLLRIRFFKLMLSIKLMRLGFSKFVSFVINKDDYEALGHYISADLIFSTGGTYLIENYDLKSCIYDYRLSLAAGDSKLGFFTQTLGPFKTPENKRDFSYIFANSNYIFLRDEKSKRNIIELGVDGGEVFLAADAAFVLAKEVFDNAVRRKGSGVKVAISIRTMRLFHEDYAEKYFRCIANVVEHLVLRYQAQIIFLSTCQGIDEYVSDADMVKSAMVYINNPVVNQSLVVDNNFRQPDEIVDAYSEFDLVIATRMHAAILSICAGTPTIGIAYEFKTLELFKNIGMPEMSCAVEDLGFESLNKTVDQYFENEENYIEHFRQAAKSMKKQAWSVLDRLP